MKKMITAVAALLLSAAAFAQTAYASTSHESLAPAGNQQKASLTAEERAKRETEKMNSVIALGASYDKVYAANLDFAKKRMEAKNDARQGGSAVSDDKRRQIAESHKKDLETAMGKDLYTKFVIAMKEQRDQRKAHRDIAPAAPAPSNK